MEPLTLTIQMTKGMKGQYQIKRNAGKETAFYKFKCFTLNYRIQVEF